MGGVGKDDVKRVSGVWCVSVGWFPVSAATTAGSRLFNTDPKETNLRWVYNTVVCVAYPN